MKKKWEKPVIEVLDISQTMLGKNGNHLDADFSAGAHFDELTFS
ncbi:paeninodin family lasso peptide [Siminovitchia sediminis]|uniref:Paeninodin family lasso peptide n=1 Tax=Siminovitchia sediminis TaxID=1274353 RepID=A0ABW4KKX0_9BACI